MVAASAVLDAEEMALLAMVEDSLPAEPFDPIEDEVEDLDFFGLVVVVVVVGALGADSA